MHRISRFFLALAFSVLGVSCATTTAPPTVTPAPVAAADHPIRSRHAMVVSANWIASEVGREVMRNGGNAVDAAVAAGFALAVTHPQAGNIGGGGFMVIRFPDGSSKAIDFREKAPLAAHPGMFLDQQGNYSSTIHHSSHRAVGVPGTVAGFALAHRSYGSAPWSGLVAPSVKLAEDGFELSETLATSLESALKRMRPYPASVAAFSREGTPYGSGDRFRQPDLGRTLKRIQQHGPDGFYRGETAKLIVAEMQRNGGLISLRDLEIYRAQERMPIKGRYRDYEILSMPPPSSGGVAVVQMLNILERFDLATLGHNSAPYVHRLTEAMRMAFRDRARYLADSDFVEIPVKRLTSKRHARRLAHSLSLDKAGRSAPSDVQEQKESPETTHYSVVDAQGMAVSVTYTLEYSYGSAIVVPGGGFLLNNEMGDFNARQGLTTTAGLIGTTPNLARPQQRMLSSMTPTILARNDQLVAVFGSPGGRTIINTVLQLALNVMEFRMNIQQAVNAPRFHHQWLPDEIRFEKNALKPEAIETLKGMGHAMKAASSQGKAHSIMIDPVTGERLGAPDPRDPDSGAAGF